MSKWRWPGSKPWVQTTVAMMQTADWDEGGGNGILKFDDGTLWYWSGEMVHTAYQYFSWWAVINEHKPGAKAWEQIMPDYWSDVIYPSYGDEWLQTGATGELIDGVLLSDHWLVAHDGGDKSYWFSIWGDYLTNADLACYIVSKDTRTWELKILDWDNDFNLHGQPVIWGGYVWYLTRQSTVVDGSYVGNARLNRMMTDAPYTVNVVREFPWASPPLGGFTYDDYWSISPSTGLPYFFDNPFVPSTDPAVGVDDDGYLYVMNYMSSYQRNDLDVPIPASGGAGLWRLKLPYGEWELVYYHFVEPNWDYRYIGSYNLPGGAINDRWHGPLPIGIGFIQNWWHSKIGIQDGWLYWVNNTGQFTMLSSGWTGGHTFCRMRISDLKDGPVKHRPENPTFEVISMTTGGEESFYNWDDTEYWGGQYGSWGGYGWRDGINSIHAFVENMWFFDDDGSIVFVHHEYPDFYMPPGGYYPSYILSRLSPPENLPITLNLVFEGEEMKGYGHARQVPTKTKIGTIELSGE